MKTRFSQWNGVLGAGGRGLLIVCIFMFHFTNAAIASVTLAWDPNSESSLAGYNLYRSTQSGVFGSVPLNGTPLTTTSFTDSTATSGTYYYVVRAVSVNGQQSAPSNQVQVNLNPVPTNSAPVVSAGPNSTITLPASTTLTATATDDGLPHGTLTYSWTVASGTGVTYTSPNSSSTQVSFSQAGTYTLTVTVSDGQLSSSANVVVTVMNAGPATISITGPANGVTVSGSVPVSATASSSGGIAGVQFKLDGTNLGGEKTTAPYATTWDTTQVPNGSHVLTAVARDTAGNLTTSAGMIVTVSNTSATIVSITAPTSGATVSGKSVTVSADASNTSGIAGVQFKLDGTNLGAEKTSAPYATTWDTTQAANGSHVLTAVARDTTGNLTTSAGMIVTVSNTSATTVSITAPTSGTTVSGKSVTVSADASNTSGIAGVQFKLDGTNLGAEKTSAPYATTWDTTQAVNGSHVLTAVARDTAGNLTTSAALFITINNASTTTVSITVPPGTVSGTSVTVSANASSTAGIAGVQFQLDGVNLGAETTTSPYSITWNTTQTTNGKHLLTAVARDASGNLTTSSAVTVIVTNNSARDNTPPTVSITSPAVNATASGTVTISALASDDVGVAGLQFKVDGANLGPEQTGATYAIFWDTTQVSNGNHTLTAMARDSAGNQTTSAAVLVKVSNASTSSTLPPTGASSVAYSLADRGADLLTENSTSDSINVGYARVQTDAGSSALGGAAIFSYHSDGAVVSETSVPLSPLVQSGRMYVEMNGPVSTGVAFANPNKEDAVISFYFTDIHNNALGYREGTFILGANCQMSGFLNQAPFNLANSTEGTFTFTSSIGVSMVALRGFTNERNVFLMSTLPVPTLDTTDTSPLAVLPHFAAGAGWTTKLVLVNPTDAVLSGNAQFFSPAVGYSVVSPLTLTVNDVPMSGFNYSIPARGVFAVTLNSADGSLASGSIRISASNGSIAPSGLAIFSLMNNGVTVSEASVPISPPAFALRVYAQSQGEPDAVGSSKTAIALANPTSSSAVVTFELIQADGTSTGLATSMMIPPGGQMSQFVNELIPNTPATFSGVLHVSSATPVIGIGLRLTTNGGGDVLMSTIPAVSETQNGTPQPLLFPHVVSGGGFTTELILLNRQPSATSSGEVIFTGQDGAPLSVQ